MLKVLAEKEKLLVTEAMAIAGTSTFHQRYLPYLEEKGYIISEKIQIGRKGVRYIRLTNKGKRLFQLLDELNKLDESV
ncbi:MAG: hypothetical protein GSR82_02465 [Desulfurococcales archaeon]|nr:hypothetical protein [Desulfurococcales archaeon]